MNAVLNTVFHNDRKRQKLELNDSKIDATSLQFDYDEQLGA